MANVRTGDKDGSPISRLNGSPRIVATYDYKDEAGVLLYQVVRYEPGFNGERKAFRQRRPDGRGGWISNLQGVPRVLYRLPELLASKEAGRPVFAVEGEKDADRLHAIGLIATTNAMGAGKWLAEYREALRGRRVVIIADNDEPGRQHAETIAKSLAGVAAAVCVLELPGLPPKGDVSDWLDAGGTRDALLQLAGKAPAWQPVTRPEPEPTAATKPEREATQAERLLELAEGLEYFHAPDSRAFATAAIGADGRQQETLPIRGRDFRDLLCRNYYRATGKAPTIRLVNDILGVLEARARYDGEMHPVYTRLGETGDAICLDLCDRQRRTIVITAEGWRISEASPVRFRRPRGMLPLPEPTLGGGIEELRSFLNVAEGDWPLVVAWLLQAMRPTGPYPILCLHGEQGSAKSTTARVLRALVDPNSVPLRTEPRELRDLMIMASNSWVVALDNLSYLPGWLSDALCRLSTGGGFCTRELYTDADEIVLEAQRPVIITGVEELATRGDLLDRCLVVNLSPIAEGCYRPEAAIWRAFERVRQRILAALLEAAAGGLRGLPRVDPDALPRMADFATWIIAAEPALGWQQGTFKAAYAGNRRDVNQLALDTSPLVKPLREFVAGHGWWEGQASDLLQELGKLVSQDVQKSREWPKRPHTLSNRLRRLAANLRRTGIGVDFERTMTARLVRVQELGKEASSAS